MIDDSEEIIRKLWTNIETEKDKTKIVRSFLRTYSLQHWIREMNVRGRVHFYRNRDVGKIIWVEAFTLGLEAYTKPIFWTGWSHSFANYYKREFDRLSLVILFGDTPLFCVIGPEYFKNWYTKKPNARQNKYYFKIYPTLDGLRFVVNGSDRIFDGLISGSFMSVNTIDETLKDVPIEQKQDYYRVLLEAVKKGPPMGINPMIIE